MKDDAERARACLATEWEKSGRPELAQSIRNGRDDEWSKAGVAIRAMLAFAQQPEGMVLVPAEVVTFLRGETALDGSWFGDTFSGEGAYWWRKYLWPDAPPAAMLDVAPIPGED